MQGRLCLAARANKTEVISFYEFQGKKRQHNKSPVYSSGFMRDKRIVFEHLFDGQSKCKPKPDPERHAERQRTPRQF